MKYRLIFLICLLVGCMSNPEKTPIKEEANYDDRKIIVYDEGLHEIIDPNIAVEVLAEGFEWSEGPLWLPTENKLIFSDIPPNTIYEWSEQKGKKIYLKPSGYTGLVERSGESGSNGLLLDQDSNLVLCQHGDRRIARMKTVLSNPQPEFETIASQFQNKRLNSPNDATYDNDGFLFFTDPPYGLEKNMSDPLKELNWQGVYRVSPDGIVDLMVSDLSWPNGIAFAPDFSKVYVANSDAKKAVWMVYDYNISKQFINGKVFYDATESMGKGKGAPDGLKVNRNGIVFATGPGGVHVFNPAGTLLGKIQTGEATSNCTFGPDEKSLFMTADDYLMRVKLL